MPSIFTDSQVKSLKKAQGSCQKCTEALGVLRRVGFPNETLEGDVQFIRNATDEALKYHEEMRTATQTN